MALPEKAMTRPDSQQKLAAPSISLPKGGGAIRGIGEKFAANPVTGTGSMTVPIATSPGRSGFGPQLSLSYDSGAGNGPFGFGWSLSLPAITRKTDKGLPRYQDGLEQAPDSDVFILSSAEDLVPEFEKDAAGNWVLKDGKYVIHDKTRAVNGVTYGVRRYRPRIEGLFARIERWTRVDDPADVHWRSISKDNLLTLYGKDDNSRIADPAAPGHIFSWLICESRDDKGNAIIYSYKAEDGTGVDLTKAHERNRGDRTDQRRNANRYLKRICYGNRKPLLDDAGQRPRFLTQEQIDTAGWIFEVVFDYDDHDPATPEPHDDEEEDAGGAFRYPWKPRLDPFSSYRAGFEVRTYRLCQRVLMFHHIPDLATGEKGYEGLVRSTDFTYSYEKNPQDVRNPIYSFLLSVTQSGYTRQENGYLKKSLPPLEFIYSQPVVKDAVREVARESLENMPSGLDGARYQWVDLNGEGLSGILTEQADAWFYKHNLSPKPTVEKGFEKIVARFGPLELVTRKPSLAAVSSGRQQFLDLAGDGQLDLVELDAPTPGFYERTEDESWESFRAFKSLPNLAWNDPNLKFVDLTGDGHADILVTEDDVFAWYPSLAEEGFGPAEPARQALDEEKGPRLVFADGTQSIYLADLSGDGLSDLVRIRNGEVCYWPNLGYGRFGAKVTMDSAPWFDNPDQFDQKRIRLADIDGSGTTDIIHLGNDGVRLYFNQSGNSWSKAQKLTAFPQADNLSSVMVLDLLGNGTACLVWSSPLPSQAPRPMRYLDLMGGQKPHLLIEVTNNLGAETKVHYSPSTKFYVQDKLAGKPWITRIPFPVHVVERVETYDRISRNRFVTRYAYHHGYFDGIEREFRGFGMVEQWDTEKFGFLEEKGLVEDADNIDKASHVPPVLTKTWFHTGAYVEGGRISRQFEGEYYHEGDPSLGETGLSEAQQQALLLNDTVMPEDDLTPDEIREACRALKGSILRQEIFSLDGTEEEDRPYSVSERNYTIKLLQPRGKNGHAVFFTHPRETIDFHYERKLHDVEVAGKKLRMGDPRVSHTMTLAVDDYGNVERSIAIGYRRRDFADVKEPEQKDTHITLTGNRFANCADQKDWYRVGLPVETRTYEIVKPPKPNLIGPVVEPFRFNEIQELFEGRKAAVLPKEGLLPSKEIEPKAEKLWPYEKWDWGRNQANAPAETRLRLIEHVRTLYYKDDLSGPLPLKEAGSRGLLYETYNLTFTPDLVKKIYTRKRANVEEELLTFADWNKVLRDDGGYLLSNDYAALNWDADGCWWDPSGQTYYSPVDQVPPPPKLPNPLPQDVKNAEDHFLLPQGTRDPFGELTRLSYDDYDLLLTKSEDPLENIILAENDYRVLQPRLVTDPNQNRAEVAFDALGMVVGTAVIGKKNEPDGKPKGDSLDGFEPEVSPEDLKTFLAKPREPKPGINPPEQPESIATPIVHKLLGTATTRIVYDLDRYKVSGEPPFAATIARETHVSDLVDGKQSKLQVSFSYSDGFGREIQKKIQAEPGPLSESGPIINPRWVGSGWTIFNNKGKPVRQYEPFFDDTHDLKFGHKVGVSPILFYDPLERVVATLHPNHTYEKVVFDPWQQTTYDVNDTVLEKNPSQDPDVGNFLDRIPAEDYLPTWYDLRADPAKALLRWPDVDPVTGKPLPENKRIRKAEDVAAGKAAKHADTPTVAHFDTLGRTFLTEADNGAAGKYATRTELDIEGNQRAVIDARDRVVMRYDYDMLGNRIHQASMDAGERWVLNDVTGKPIRAWDTRGHNFTTEYDALRRPLNQFVRGTDHQQSDPCTLYQDLLFEKTIYGESQLNNTQLNLRTRVFKQYDGAGRVVNEAYDFKGNLLRSSRRLIKNYKKAPDWMTVPDPEAGLDWEKETYLSSSFYDALNRPIQVVAPHSDQPGAKINVIRSGYNEANLLERTDVWLGAADEPAGLLDPAMADLHTVTNIDYNAKGQRMLIRYGNGTETRYRYDSDTFRLTHLYTRRGEAFKEDRYGDLQLLPFAAPEKPPADTPCGLQNLHYTYDPAGNITHIRDDAQQTIFFKNQVVEPHCDYTYDAIYRLILATGREHLGQIGGVPVPTSPTNAPRVGLDHPNDGKAMACYSQAYEYDEVGNILLMHHKGTDPAHAGWKRCYQYALDSNRLLSTGKPNDPNNPDSACPVHYAAQAVHLEKYDYDAHGNMTSMPHLSLMHWDFQDQLSATSKQVNNNGTPEITYYVYDADGQRVRKVTDKQNGTSKDERIYLGGFEIYRGYKANGDVTKVNLERETLHIMDDKQRIALVETLILDTTDKEKGPPQLIRYQFGNHLGSASFELDDRAVPISYEEYYPYGSTSYQGGNKDIKAAVKRYRYTSKERDEETGLYYHGARYYAPWLGRWISADPVGTSGGLNLFGYVSGNPVRQNDPSGTEEQSAFHPPKLNLTAGRHRVQYKGRAVDYYYFPGTSKENALIVSGVHQSEQEAIKIANLLVKRLKKDPRRPYYNVLLIPNLFGNRHVTTRTIEGIDPNRDHPPLGKDLAHSVPSGKDTPYNAMKKPQAMLPENVILHAAREQLASEGGVSVTLAIHAIGPKPAEKMEALGGASITSDPRTGHEISDYLLAKSMAATAEEGGARLPANFRKDPKRETYHYPTESAPKSKPTMGGITLGNYGSHPAGKLSAMNMILIEILRSKKAGQEIDAYVNAIQQTFLADPWDVLFGKTSEIGRSLRFGWSNALYDSLRPISRSLDQMQKIRRVTK